MDQEELAEALTRVSGFGNQTAIGLLARTCRACNEVVQSVFSEGNIYTYNAIEGYWEPQTERTLEKYVHLMKRLLRQTQNTRIELSQGFIKGIIDCARTKLDDEKFFEQSQSRFTFKNGDLRITGERIEIIPHCHKNRSRVAMPFNCEEQPTPKWNKLLSEIFAKDEDSFEKIRFLHQFMGAALVGISTEFKQALVMLGEGRNGKSTVQRIIESLFPEKEILHSNPQGWHQEYNRAEFVGKRLNTTSELPERELLESEAAKTIIEGGTIQARIIKKRVFEFRPVAAHIFAANNLLKTQDFTEGFFRRFILLTFNNQFTQTVDHAQPIIDEELPGIAYKCIKAIEAVLPKRPRQYDLPPSHAVAIDRWKHEANPYVTFVEDCLEVDTNGKMGKLPLYRLWCAWAKEHGHKPQTQQRLAARVSSIFGQDVLGRTKAMRYYKLKMTDKGEFLAKQHLIYGDMDVLGLDNF